MGTATRTSGTAQHGRGPRRAQKGRTSSTVEGGGGRRRRPPAGKKGQITNKGRRERWEGDQARREGGREREQAQHVVRLAPACTSDFRVINEQRTKRELACVRCEQCWGASG